MAQLLSTNVTGNLIVSSSLDVGNVWNFAANNMAGRFSGNANSYIQVDVQNIGTGANSSGDLAITGDIGNDMQYFIDMGWNNSKYNDPAYAIMTANSGYLYTANGNLAIGTQNTQTDLVLFAGGTIAADESIRVYGANSDVKVSTNLFTQNVESRGNISVSTNGSMISIGTNGALMLNTSYSSPNFASANQLVLFTKNIANTQLFGTESPRANNFKFDSHSFVAVHPGFKMMNYLRPGSGITNTTIFTSVGLTMNIVANSNTPVVSTNTSFKTAQRRFNLGSNVFTNTTGNASIFANVATTFSGNSAGNPGGGGGYVYVSRFCYEAIGGANLRHFVGMSNCLTSMGQGTGDFDPWVNTTQSIVGVGGNSNALWFLCGANGAARVSSNLGTSFFINTTDVYELVLTAAPGGGSIGWRVRNLSNGAETSGVQTTNLPLGNTFMQPHFMIKNGTAVTSNIGIINLYLETDN